jgi:hypothetical protein
MYYNSTTDKEIKKLCAELRPGHDVMHQLGRWWLIGQT